MTFDNFVSLSAEEQLDMIKERGVLVGKREHPAHLIFLYQLNNYYAEVFMHKENNTVWKVGGFDHPVLLQPYLDQIDLSDLLKK